MKKGLTVLIPAYNEEKVIEKTTFDMLPYLRNLRIPFEIIICINHSEDKTRAIAEKLSKEHKEIRHFSIKKKGFGIALIEGIKHAKKDLITYMPSDGEIKVDFIESALKYFPEYDLVSGSRYLTKKYLKHALHRIFMSIILAMIVRLTISNKVTEMGTVKMFKSSWAKKAIRKCKAQNFDWQVEMLYFAIKDKLRIKEVPVTTIEIRNPSESTVNLLKDAYEFVKVCLKYGLKLKLRKILS